MLTVRIPSGREPERRYILATILSDFLGLDHDVEVHEADHTSLSADGDREVRIGDGLLAIPPEDWLTPRSLPPSPLKSWRAGDHGIEARLTGADLPILYGGDPDAPGFTEITDRRIRLGLDLFGSCFFLLTRYEEVARPRFDVHGRFPATASLAYREGFLDRPLVNEYAEILWACLNRLWPQLKRPKRSARILLSHDVDEPFLYYTRGLAGLSRMLGGDILKRRHPALALTSLVGWARTKSSGPSADPYNLFDGIMETSETLGLTSAFNFVAGRTHRTFDPGYRIDSPAIRGLIRRIHRRGHEIGLHPSYNSYDDPDQTSREFERLREVCDEEGVVQEVWGGRQHYLRWRTPTTFRNWDAAGLNYDSTLCFADHAGFRCGTCYEYSVFDVGTRRTLALRERPLIVMDGTVIDDKYMGLGSEDGRALAAIAGYRSRCEMFDGDFTILWHNSRMVDPAEAELYRRSIG